jgi:hypothetical protein
MMLPLLPLFFGTVTAYIFGTTAMAENDVLIHSTFDEFPAGELLESVPRGDFPLKWPTGVQQGEKVSKITLGWAEPFESMDPPYALFQEEVNTHDNESEGIERLSIYWDLRHASLHEGVYDLTYQFTGRDQRLFGARMVIELGDENGKKVTPVEAIHPNRRPAQVSMNNRGTGFFPEQVGVKYQQGMVHKIKIRIDLDNEQWLAIVDDLQLNEWTPFPDEFKQAVTGFSILGVRFESSTGVKESQRYAIKNVEFRKADEASSEL